MPRQYGVKPPSKEIIEDLRRKLKLADGKRKACYEEGEGIKRRNQDIIDCLQEEIKLLSRKMKDAQKRPKSPLGILDSAEAALLGKKSHQEVIEILNCQVGDLRKQIDRLRHQRVRNGQRLDVLRRQKDEMVSSTAATKCPKDNQDNKQTSLENEIQGILMKTVEATHIRRKYSSMISALTQEESDLEKVIKETEAEIQNRVNEMRTLRQVWAEAYQSEKQIRVEVKKCEQFLVTVKKDFEKRQHALRTKVSEIRTEGFLGDSDNSQGRSPGVASSCVSRYQPSMDSFQEKLRKYEEMNGQIKSQTGLEDIKELLSAVNELSEASDRLQNMELDLRHKISRLEAEKKKSESNASRPKLSRITNYKDLEGPGTETPLTRSEYKDGDLQSANDVEQLNEVRAALRLLCVKLSAAFHQPSSPPSDDPADLATLCVEKLENLVDFCGEYNQDDVVKAMEGLQLRESIDDTMALLKSKRRSESPEPIEELPEDGAYNEVGDERDVLTRIMVKKLAKQATDFHAKRQQKDSMKRK